MAQLISTSDLLVGSFANDKKKGGGGRGGRGREGGGAAAVVSGVVVQTMDSGTVVSGTVNRGMLVL